MIPDAFPILSPMNRKNIAKGIIATVLLVLGFWFLVPGRNVAGNPHLETLIDECEVVGSEERIRLYEGNGGATGAFWYSATIDPGMFALERQFFFSYSSPQIEHAQCKEHEVRLVGPTQSFAFHVKKIYDELLDNPVNFYRGEPSNVTNGFRIVLFHLD